jgi:polyhydroxybutyrate depolymerase
MSTARVATLALAALLLWPLLDASWLAAGTAESDPAGTGAADPAGTGEADPAASPAPSCQPTLSIGTQSVTLDVDGESREVIIHVPGIASGSRPPAVVAFHGYTALASQLEETSGLSELADESGFVVAYPQGLGIPPEWHFQGNRGSDERDLRMVEILLDELVTEACADPVRIVLAGHSMGGGMASDTACRLADRVAGAVLVAALWFEPPCEPARPVPVVATHALDDEVLPYAGGQIGGVPSSIPDVLPVEEAIGAWAAHDGCEASPAVAGQADGSAILTWSGCQASVVLHRLPSGGHAWPAIASDLIVELLATTG